MKFEKNEKITLLVFLIIVVTIFGVLYTKLYYLKKENEKDPSYQTLKNLNITYNYKCNVLEVVTDTFGNTTTRNLPMQIQIIKNAHTVSKVIIPNGETYDLKYEKPFISWKNKSVNLFTNEPLIINATFNDDTKDLRLITRINNQIVSDSKLHCSPEYNR